MKLAVKLILLILISLTACERVNIYETIQELELSKSFVAVSSAGSIWYTEDITEGNWNSITPGNPFADITYGKSRLVTAGGSFPPNTNGFIISGSDTPSLSVVLPTGTYTTFKSISYLDGIFIAIGDDGGATRHITTSTDGESWSAANTTPAGVYNANFNLKEVAYGNGYFVIAGGFSTNGEIARSDDTITWTMTSPACSYLNGVTYGDGKFVVAGRTGAILYSTDNGVNWTDASPGGNDLNSIAHGKGTYVAVGASGQVWSSSDGINWTDRTTIASTLYRVVYSGKKFVAVGTAGTVIWSTDGKNWTNSSTGGGDDLNGITNY